MNRLVLQLSLLVVMTVLASAMYRSPTCKYGKPYWPGGKTYGCRRYGLKHCPRGYRCVGASAYRKGVCCPIWKPPIYKPRCKYGKPLKIKGHLFTCGTIAGIPCPSRQYTCKTNPLIADAGGVCCPWRPFPIYRR